MNLEQLLQFKKVAETNSVTKASKELYVSQPAISKGIRKLEGELGNELFFRENNNMVLNAVGKKVLMYVNQIDDCLKMIVKAAKSPRDAGSCIRIGAVSPSSLYSFISGFQACYPDMELRTLFISQELVSNALIDRTVDFMVSSEPMSNPMFICTPLCQERAMLSVPVTNPLSEKDVISLKDLDGEKVLLISNCKSELNDRIGKFLNHNQIKVNYLEQVDVMIVNLLAAVPGGEYIYFTSNIKRHFFPECPDRVCIPILEKEALLDYYFIYRKDNYLSVEPFLNWIQSNYDKLNV